jgi:hypothetical protein
VQLFHDVKLADFFHSLWVAVSEALAGHLLTLAASTTTIGNRKCKHSTNKKEWNGDKQILIGQKELRTAASGKL